MATFKAEAVLAETGAASDSVSRLVSDFMLERRWRSPCGRDGGSPLHFQRSHFLNAFVSTQLQIHCREASSNHSPYASSSLTFARQERNADASGAPLWERHSPSQRS